MRFFDEKRSRDPKTVTTNKISSKDHKIVMDNHRMTIYYKTSKAVEILSEWLHMILPKHLLNMKTEREMCQAVALADR